jgi:hypothetical protein
MKATLPHAASCASKANQLSKLRRDIEVRGSTPHNLRRAINASLAMAAISLSSMAAFTATGSAQQTNSKVFNSTAVVHATGGKNNGIIKKVETNASGILKEAEKYKPIKEVMRDLGIGKDRSAQDAVIIGAAGTSLLAGAYLYRLRRRRNLLPKDPSHPDKIEKLSQSKFEIEKFKEKVVEGGLVNHAYYYRGRMRSRWLGDDKYQRVFMKKYKYGDPLGISYKTPLTVASGAGRHEKVRLLLQESQVKPLMHNIQSALRHALLRRRLEIEAAIDKAKKTELYEPDYIPLGKTETLETVRLLLRAGGDINREELSYGKSYLVQAIEDNDIESAKLYILYGADIYKRSPAYIRELPDHTTYIEAPPIFFSIAHRRDRITKLLLDNGAAEGVTGNLTAAYIEAYSKENSEILFRYKAKNMPGSPEFFEYKRIEKAQKTEDSSRDRDLLTQKYESRVREQVPPKNARETLVVPGRYPWEDNQYFQKKPIEAVLSEARKARQYKEYNEFMFYVKLTEGSKRGIYYWYKSHLKPQSPEYKMRKIGAEMDAEVRAEERLEKLRDEEFEAQRKSKSSQSTHHDGSITDRMDRNQGPTP